MKDEAERVSSSYSAFRLALSDRVRELLSSENINSVMKKSGTTNDIERINAFMNFIKDDITRLELEKQELEKRPTLERAQELEQQARTAQQELVTERRARQDEIKSFCKELRKAMAGKGFKREHFSQLEQWTNQANEQAISFSEFQQVALAIFGEYGAVFADEYKDYLSPEQVEDEVNFVREQYKAHLSPDEVEAKRRIDFIYPCTLVGVCDIPEVADEARDSLESGIEQLKGNIEQLEGDKKQLKDYKESLESDLMALCKLVGVDKWSTPKYAKEDIEKSIKKLQAQAGKTQELTTRAESAEKQSKEAKKYKEKLEGAINTTYSALIEGQKAGDELTALDKLTAVEVKGREVLKTIGTQQGTITGLNEQINQQAGEITRLNGELTTKTQELNIATQNATQSTKSKQKVDTAFNDLKAKYEALEGDYNALQTQNTEDKGKIQKLNDELARLEAQVSTSSAPANPSAQSNPYQSPEQEYTALIAEINKLDPQIAQELFSDFFG